MCDEMGNSESPGYDGDCTQRFTKAYVLCFDCLKFFFFGKVAGSFVFCSDSSWKASSFAQMLQFGCIKLSVLECSGVWWHSACHLTILTFFFILTWNNNSFEGCDGLTHFWAF